jgi:hypothetical protein
MFEQHVARLKSIDVGQRREAIVALGKSGDPRALPHLNRIATADPDPSLRELAAKAGRYLQRQGVIAAPSAEQPLRQVKPVSEKDRQRAKAFLDRAYDHRFKQQTNDAIAELARALRLDPALADEPGVKHFAADLTGTSDESVMQALFKKDREWEVRQHRMRPRGKEPLIFLSEMILLFVVVTALFAAFSGGLVKALGTLAEESVKPTSVFHVMQSSFTGIQPANLPTAAMTALLVIITLMFANAITYAVGLSLGGAADLFRFLNILLFMQIVTYILVVGAQVQVLLPLLAEPDKPEASIQNLIWLSIAISGITAFFLVIAESYVVGTIQKFGFIRGFVNVIIGNIVFACMWTTIGFFVFRH